MLLSLSGQLAETWTLQRCYLTWQAFLRNFNGTLYDLIIVVFSMPTKPTLPEQGLLPFPWLTWTMGVYQLPSTLSTKQRTLTPWENPCSRGWKPQSFFSKWLPSWSIFEPTCIFFLGALMPFLITGILWGTLVLVLAISLLLPLVTPPSLATPFLAVLFWPNCRIFQYFLLFLFLSSCFHYTVS